MCENDGFFVLCPKCPKVRVRLRGTVSDYDLSGSNELDHEIRALILAIVHKYAYML